MTKKCRDCHHYGGMQCNVKKAPHATNPVNTCNYADPAKKICCNCRYYNRKTCSLRTPRFTGPMATCNNFTKHVMV
ncbi:MAG: hypothetical protein LBQ96_04260 [Fusobacteriaceae bacterium]|nr:hypothetical protein [Fusobacteriaceae bacterium]